MDYDTKERLSAFFLDKVLKILCTIINVMSNILPTYSK